MKRVFTVEEEYINSRLDRWFRRKLCDVPQSLIEKNIRKGNIRVNYKKIKSFYKLQKNDQILIKNFNFKTNKNKKKNYVYKPSKKELLSSSNIFIENNENFVIINKPSGIAVQPGAKSVRNIIDILRGTKEFKNSSPFPVHRIDKETTGVLIVAKNRKYAQLFTYLFRVRKIHKTYLGIVVGKLRKDKGTFIDELSHYEGDKMIKTKAITHYCVLDSSSNYTFLKLNPETGRKHQLRKQLLIHNCPILGDNKYRLSMNRKGKKNLLMLHAYKIKFTINELKYNFSAELPSQFKKTLKEKYLKIL